MPVYECNQCDLVYAGKILNDEGLKIYWSSYESQVHNATEIMVKNRQQMYDLELNYIKAFIDLKDSTVLDVGCSNGDFLDCFAKEGADCEGVEIGDEAYLIASKKHKCYKGCLPDLEIDKKYDLIICRGTIQYMINPKNYFRKMVSLLKPEGMIYITSSSNFGSLCANLFKDKFRLHVSETDYYGFKEPIITNFLDTLGMKLINRHDFYLETPYANLEEDIKKVALALEYKLQGKKIDFQSPPFFDNMLTLVYKKIE